MVPKVIPKIHLNLGRKCLCVCEPYNLELLTPWALAAIMSAILSRISLSRDALPSPRMRMNSREWCNNASQVALPTLRPPRMRGRKAREGGRSLEFKTRRMFFLLSYKSFTIICFHVNFFSFDRQNMYSCKSDLFANFSAVDIFPCNLNCDIP